MNILHTLSKKNRTTVSSFHGRCKYIADKILITFILICIYITYISTEIIKFTEYIFHIVQ